MLPRTTGLVFVVVSAVAVATLLLSSSAVVSAQREMDLWCGACKGLFDEIEYQVSTIHPKKKLDVGGFRIDPNGDLKQALSVKYARSETFLTEVLETVCKEMKNYSGYEEDGRTIYRRYQNRPGVKKVLNLKNFGWSVDSQDHLRLACDAISAEISDEIVDFYMKERDAETNAKKFFCKRYCAAADAEYRKIQKKRKAEAAAKAAAEAEASAAAALLAPPPTPEENGEAVVADTPVETVADTPVETVAAETVAADTTTTTTTTTTSTTTTDEASEIPTKTEL